MACPAHTISQLPSGRVEQTFLVGRVLQEADVAEVKHAGNDAEEVGLLLGAETDAVHRVLEHPVLLLVSEGGVMEGGRVEVLVREERWGGEEGREERKQI